MRFCHCPPLHVAIQNGDSSLFIHEKGQPERASVNIEINVVFGKSEIG